MSNISYLCHTSLVSYAVNESGKIILGNFLMAVFPEFLVFVRIILSMVSWEFSTSMVSKPDIVTLAGQVKCWWIFIIHYPIFSRAQKTMLKEDNWCSGLGTLLFDSKQAQYIPIFCYYWVALMIQTLIDS